MRFIKIIILFFPFFVFSQTVFSQEVKRKKVLSLGEEIPSTPEEEQLNEQLIKILKGVVQNGYNLRQGQDHPAKRDAHAKQHGCVAAKFKIEANIPSKFRKGIFSTKGEYKAILRFSNGTSDLKSDKIADAHGMAIKVLDVKANLLNFEEANGEINTQDFVMIDHPVFFLRNSKDYLPLMMAQKNGPEGFKEWLKNNPYEGEILKALSKTQINPLASQYWSQTPYKIGEKSAMKFTAKPCSGQNFIDIPKEQRQDNFLADALAMNLASNEFCFDFYIIPQRDAKQHLIEDSTVEWPTIWKGKNNIFKVATIYIPKEQAPNSSEALKICEELSFTPWHGSEDLRPLGGINRTRKKVYLELSKFRNELNSVAPTIPSSETWEILLPK
ncbi:catalase family protein [Pigmentibacter sp. JX0631]|uniref:catalase family protein n=1 Tax=Pigmentibacter sp. JX0631 TaxID=2976982 RepID=UPI002469365C|nr:catalase family protein [Pigmentibacter sp. JX0631]WGL60981.1 catalase family protein [Pigmentibacter sp. JX0631]